MKLPLISFIIPTLNEEKRIGFCLKSLLSQGYPKDKMEIIIVDGGSTDGTIDLVKNFKPKVNLKIVDNSLKKDPETAKLLGFKKATGEIFTCFDADMYLNSSQALKTIVGSLLRDPTLCASFVGYFVKKTDTALNRFLSYDYLQRDPLYKFLTPKLEDSIIEEYKNYKVCLFNKENLPTVGGTTFFRRKTIEPILKNKEKYFDIDIPLELIDRGYYRFAYVFKVGYYHRHAINLAHLLKKRLRNIDNQTGNGYLPNYHQRKYLWLDITKPADLLKLFFWVIYANLFFPELIRGIIRAIKYQDAALLYQPIVALTVTDTVVFGFLKNPLFWKILKKKIENA